MTRVRMNYSKPQSLDTQEGAGDLGAMGFIVKQIDELNNQLSRIDALAVSGKVIRETGKGLLQPMRSRRRPDGEPSRCLRSPLRRY